MENYVINKELDDSLKFNKIFEFLNDLSDQKLKLNINLPHFFVPADKADLFIKWYDNDLDSLKELPKIYNDFYITIETDSFLKITGPSIFDQNNFINDDYKRAYNLYNNLKNEFKYITAHIYYQNFKIKIDFYNNNDLIEEVTFYKHQSTLELLEMLNEENYLKNNHLYTINLNKYQKNIVDYFYPSLKDLVQLTHEKEVFDENVNLINVKEDLPIKDAWKNFIVFFCSDLLRVCIANIWYVATYNLKNKNKDNYNERLKFLEESNLKRLEKSKKLKILTRKIYNLEKIKNHTTVDRLVKSRKGWSVSIEHDVRGHWRHYRDGKVIFIESYVRCKGRGQKQNNIILNPKSYVNN